MLLELMMIKPNFLLDNIYCLTDDFLCKNNIRGIIFDIDNTLVGFTVKKPDEKIADFIKNLKDKGIKIAIASNNNQNRVSTFCENLDIPYVWRACKPLPFSLLKIKKMMKIKCKNIALVGDQVFTDVWGANICGMTSVMVDIIDTKETLLFKIKRALEKPIINSKRREDMKRK